MVCGLFRCRTVAFKAIDSPGLRSPVTEFLIRQKSPLSRRQAMKQRPCLTMRFLTPGGMSGRLSLDQLFHFLPEKIEREHRRENERM